MALPLRQLAQSQSQDAQGRARDHDRPAEPTACGTHCLRIARILPLLLHVARVPLRRGIRPQRTHRIALPQSCIARAPHPAARRPSTIPCPRRTRGILRRPCILRDFFSCGGSSSGTYNSPCLGSEEGRCDVARGERGLVCGAGGVPQEHGGAAANRRRTTRAVRRRRRGSRGRSAFERRTGGDDARGAIPLMTASGAREAAAGASPSTSKAPPYLCWWVRPRPRP